MVSIMNRKLKILLFILLLPVGVFFFVFGEFDDSPGGQLLGILMFLAGIIGLVRIRKNRSTA